MVTNLAIDDELLEEALLISGLKTEKIPSIMLYGSL